MMDFYAISRIDLSAMRSHGWQVRLTRRGRKYSRFFSDRKYGGREVALRTARDFRDELLARLSDREKSGAAGKMTRRNISGVVGVSRIVVRTAGAKYEFWQATWSPDPGLRRRVKFSIRRYGENRAFQLACAARREAMGD